MQHLKSSPLLTSPIDRPKGVNYLAEHTLTKQPSGKFSRNLNVKNDYFKTEGGGSIFPVNKGSNPQAQFSSPNHMKS